MEILNRIIDTAKKKGIQQQQICNALEISSGIFSTWKKRQTDPPAKYIVSICKVLDVSPYYLLTGKEEQNNDLSENSVKMLEVFSLLTQNQQLELIGYAKRMADETTPEIKESVS